MAYQVSCGLADRIEDLIARNSKAPAILQNELRGLLKEGISIQDVDMALQDSVLFGDPKLNEIVLNNLRGNPLDAAYIQAIDFCERDFSEEVIGRLENQCSERDKSFLDTVVKPTFITDWPVHKHEMVANYELPLYDAEHVTDNGDLRVLCSPTTISMLDYISQSVPSIPASMVAKPEEAEVLVASAEDLELAKTVIEKIQGPTLDEYLKGLGITTLEPKIVSNLTECEGLGLCKVKASIHGDSDFSAKIYDTSKHSLDTIVKWILNRSLKNSSDQSENEKEEVVLSPSDISDALIYTGTAADKEQYLEPDYLPLWEQMKRDGLDKVVPYGDGSLSKLLEEKEILSPADEILVIMSKPTHADRVKEFENYKLRAKPMDFLEVYKFCQNFSENKAEEVKKGRNGEFLSENGSLFKVLTSQKRKYNAIPSGDTAQDRGGSSAPRSMR